MARQRQNPKSTEKPPGNGQPGLAARLVAASLLESVVDRHAILDALTRDESDLAGWRRLSDRDRSLAKAITLTALRHRGAISTAIGRLVDRPPPKKARHLIHCLHVSAAQLLFMDVPDSAAVNLGVAAIAGDKRTTRFAGFANAVLRNMARRRDELCALPADPEAMFVDWLARQLKRDYGREATARIAEMMMLEPLIDLTPHSRLDAAGRKKLADELGAELLATGSLRLDDTRPVETLPGFEEGQWWVQDAAASLPARLLGDVKGMRVADLCAAPGGKTMQLAAAGADVTAVDISPARLARLEQNLRRVSLNARIVEADILDWHPQELFDAVLLDAPCSATGTMRRHPDIAWNRTRENVDQLVELQQNLLMAAKSLVRPGGLIVYANCSILKCEGEDRLAAWRNEAPDLVHLPLNGQEFPEMAKWINGQGALRTLPFHLPAEPARQGGMVGFFACRFRVAG